MKFSVKTRLLFIAPFAAFAGLLFYFAEGLKRDPSTIPTVLLDQRTPEFSLPPIEGYERGLASGDLAGEVTLLNVFASWCVSCRIEHPLLMELADADTISIMGLNWKDKPGDGAAWLATFGDPYTLIGDDADGRVAIDFGVTGAPETFIIDRRGRIRYKQVGPITPQIWREDIEPVIMELRNEDDKSVDAGVDGLVPSNSAGAGS